MQQGHHHIVKSDNTHIPTLRACVIFTISLVSIIYVNKYLSAKSITFAPLHFPVRFCYALENTKHTHKHNS